LSTSAVSSKISVTLEHEIPPTATSTTIEKVPHMEVNDTSMKRSQSMAEGDRIYMEDMYEHIWSVDKAGASEHRQHSQLETNEKVARSFDPPDFAWIACELKEKETSESNVLVASKVVDTPTPEERDVRYFSMAAG
jgi:hypothetical protein